MLSWLAERISQMPWFAYLLLPAVMLGLRSRRRPRLREALIAVLVLVIVRTKDAERRAAAMDVLRVLERHSYRPSRRRRIRRRGGENAIGRNRK